MKKSYSQIITDTKTDILRKSSKKKNPELINRFKV